MLVPSRGHEREGESLGACRIAEVLDVEAKLTANGHKLRGLEDAGPVETAAKKLVVHMRTAREFAD